MILSNTNYYKNIRNDKHNVNKNSAQIIAYKVNLFMIFCFLDFQYRNKNMKNRKTGIEPHIIDQNYINSIFQKVTSNIQILDKLNTEYKIKQEEYYLKTFMNVLEKMGNQLLIAQLAYKNVDLEAKKDDYCLLLAQELNFFKKQCYQLRSKLYEAQSELKSCKSENMDLQEELNYAHELCEKKMKQNLRLKSQIKELKKAIRDNGKSNSKYSKLPNFEMLNQSQKRSLSLNQQITKNRKQLSLEKNQTNSAIQPKRKTNSTILQNYPLSLKKNSNIKNHQVQTIDSSLISKIYRNNDTLTSANLKDKQRQLFYYTHEKLRDRKQWQKQRKNMPEEYLAEMNI